MSRREIPDPRQQTRGFNMEEWASLPSAEVRKIQKEMEYTTVAAARKVGSTAVAVVNAQKVLAHDARHRDMLVEQTLNSSAPERELQANLRHLLGAEVAIAT